jgi:hypothetical protein
MVATFACGVTERETMPPSPRHATIVLERPAADAEPAAAPWISESQIAPFPFDELLASWNVAGGPFAVDVRVGAGAIDSPWLRLAEHGSPANPTSSVTDFDGGRVDVDFFRAAPGVTFERARLRITALDPAQPCRVERVAWVFTARATPGADSPPRAAPPQVDLDLAVPVLSQHGVDPALASRICSPTSVAMVLAYYGVDIGLEELAAAIHDPRHDLYGNWPRAVQVAFEHGIEGHLERFSDWEAVATRLASGTPLIASIAVVGGALEGAPYRDTAGHLVVIRGLEGGEYVIVNDPAVAAQEDGRRRYRRDQFERAWMARGGTAYVLTGPKDLSGVSESRRAGDESR